MKKIQKISINPEKVIKNDELVNLRGGYGGCNCLCYDQDGAGNKINTSEVTCCSQELSQCCTTDYMNCW